MGYVVLWSLGFHASSGERGGGRGRGLWGSYRIQDTIRHAQYVCVTGFAEANDIVKKEFVEFSPTCVHVSAVKVAKSELRKVSLLRYA